MLKNFRAEVDSKSLFRFALINNCVVEMFSSLNPSLNACLLAFNFNFDYLAFNFRICVLS